MTVLSLYSRQHHIDAVIVVIVVAIITRHECYVYNQFYATFFDWLCRRILDSLFTFHITILCSVYFLLHVKWAKKKNTHARTQPKAIWVQKKYICMRCVQRQMQNKTLSLLCTQLFTQYVCVFHHFERKREKNQHIIHSLTHTPACARPCAYEYRLTMHWKMYTLNKLSFVINKR